MDAQYSGVPEYTLNLIKEILRLDSHSAGSGQAKNEYKLFYNSGRDLSNRIPKFEGNNIEIKKTNYPNKVFNYFFQKTLKYPKIDELLGVDLFFMPHINFVSLSHKCKKIITIHDLSFLRYPDFFSLRKNIWHRIVNVKKLLSQFDIIVAVSENTKKDIIELCGINPEKIRVIYSGIGEEYKKIDSRLSPYSQVQNQEDIMKLLKTKRRYDLPDKFILFLATLEPRKNVGGLIQAFDQFISKYPKFEDYNLIIAGGKGWKGKSIFSTWQKSKHRDKIRFLGYINKDDKKYLYNLASLFVYPSFYEGFGFPPLEAMKCGLPVITSNSSSLPEIVKDNAILINPYNINEISEAIYQVLSDKNLRHSISEKSLGYVRRFSWEKTARQTIDIYKELL